jgi:hypothetical protein
MQVRQIFEAALERPREERAAFLDVACAGRPGLRAEVASLLDAHDTTSEFIEAPAAQVVADLLADSSHDSLDGRTLGPYLIRHEIGRGGMGIVYLADDTRLSRRVALKAIAPGTGGPPDRRRERMRQEARAAAALSHPGIATVYALEEIDDQLYLACEYVPGPTLRSLMQERPLPPEQVVDIALQLARALAAAHAQGVVHRDLKPENIIRTAAGVVKVLDFGVARVEQFASVRLTEPATRIGTPAYMSPEQIRGEDVDFRADLFAFGLLVYEMASGSNPFEATTPTATIARILEVNPAPLSRVSSTGFAKLDRIVATCLNKAPHDRYASTEKLVNDLERLGQKDSSELNMPAGRAQSPAWWWGVHQVTVATTYVLMLYPVWRARPWLPRPWGTVFLFSVLACAAIAATVRLHLWFTARFYPSELPAQRRHARVWTRASDIGLCVALLLAAFGLADLHPEVATLFVAVSLAAALASFLIEPATTRAAFGES